MEGVPVQGYGDYEEEVKEILTWRYPYLAASQVGTKQSVSEIKRMKEIQDEYSVPSSIRKAHATLYERPAFMKKNTHSSRTRDGHAYSHAAYPSSFK